MLPKFLGDPRQIAFVNPRLAAALVLAQQASSDRPSSDKTKQVRPAIYTLKATFSNGAIGSATKGSLEEKICADFVITGVDVQVRRTGAFAGSIMKAQSDVFNAQNSGIDAEVELVGSNWCPGYELTDSPTPIESLAKSIPEGTMLGESTNVKATFTVARTLAADEVPTDVFLIFRGWSLGCSSYELSATQLSQTIAALKG